MLGVHHLVDQVAVVRADIAGIQADIEAAVAVAVPVMVPVLAALGGGSGRGERGGSDDAGGAEGDDEFAQHGRLSCLMGMCLAHLLSR